jgi:glycosyltransferase involved in cell wall biosynthesis/O-antigen/teichoic acid export membrane protein
MTAPGLRADAGPATRSPTRILHVINMGTTCGGAERLVADLVASQRQLGHEVKVLSSDLPGTGTRFSDVTWAQAHGHRGLLTRLAGQVVNPAARRALSGVLDSFRPHVVHLHTIGLLAPASLAVLARTPTVLTVHGPEVYVRGTERWCLPAHYFRGPDVNRGHVTWRGLLAMLVTVWIVGRLWRRGLRVVDVHTAPSRYLASVVAHDFGPTRVVANGSRRTGRTDHPPRPRDAEDPRRPRLLFVGRLEAFKGPQILLDAMPAVLAAHPEALLTICGDGPMAGPLREQIARLNLTGHVELVGWLDQPELDRLRAAADVVVVPSIWPESFGLTCLEAFAAGTAVVASAVGGLPDLVRPGVTGLLVPPGDVAALASAVSRVLGDESLRERLQSRCHETAKEYTLDDHVAGIAAAYSEAIGRHAPHPPEPATTGGPALSRTIAGRVRAVLGESLLRNSALLLVATTGLAAGGFVFWQVVTHLFSPADVGRAGALISVSTLVANLALLGMNNSIIRYLSAWPNRAQTVNSAVTLVAGAALVAATALVVAVPAMTASLAVLRRPVDALVFVALTVAAAVSLLYDNVFVALRHSGYVLVRNALVVLLRLVLPVALVGLQAFGIFTAYWLPVATSLAIYLGALRFRFGLPTRLSARRDRLAAMRRYAAGNYLATAIIMLPSLLMPVLVAQMLGAAQAGYYYICALVASALVFVPQATARSLFAEATHDNRLLHHQVRRVIRLTALLQTPLLIGLLVAGPVVLALFSPVYAGEYPLLVLLAGANAVASVSFIGSTLLLIAGRMRLLCQLSAVACVISLVGAVALARHGLIWVGVALCAAEMVLALGYLRVIVAAARGSVEVDGRADAPAADEVRG